MNILSPHESPNDLIVIPACEPDGRLLRLTEELRSKGRVSVLVVDDGSRTQSAVKVFNTLNPAVVLLRHSRNRGKGAALKTALRYAAGRCPPRENGREESGQRLY